jgi:hypothetical protein
MSEQTTLDVQPAKPSRAGNAVSPMTTRQLNELLHAHFIKPADRTDPAGAGAVYLTEVTDPGGRGRRADAVHIGLWHSRGAGRIDVLELKTSRSDFRRELDQPAKAEAWWPYSTTFSIVAPSEDIAPPEELPPGWGLMVPNPRAGLRRFKTVVKPAEREPELTIGLLITLLKNTETTRVNAMRAVSDKVAAEHRAEIERLRREKSTADPESRSRLKLLDRLEAAMRLRLHDSTSPWSDWLSPEDAAEGLAEFMAGHQARIVAGHRAAQQAQHLDRVARALMEEAKTLRETHR